MNDDKIRHDIIENLSWFTFRSSSTRALKWKWKSIFLRVHRNQFSTNVCIYIMMKYEWCNPKLSMNYRTAQRVSRKLVIDKNVSWIGCNLPVEMLTKYSMIYLTAVVTHSARRENLCLVEIIFSKLLRYPIAMIKLGILQYIGNRKCLMIIYAVLLCKVIYSLG